MKAHWHADEAVWPSKCVFKMHIDTYNKKYLTNFERNSMLSFARSSFGRCERQKKNWHEIIHHHLIRRRAATTCAQFEPWISELFGSARKKTQPNVCRFSCGRILVFYLVIWTVRSSTRKKKMCRRARLFTALDYHSAREKKAFK